MITLIDYELFKISTCDNNLNFIFDIKIDGYPDQYFSYEINNKTKLNDFILFLKNINNYFIYENLLISHDLFQLNVRIGNEYRSAMEIPLKLTKEQKEMLIDAVQELLTN